MNHTSAAANQSQFAFRIADLATDTFMVQSFTSQNYGLSQHYQCQINCLANHELTTKAVVGQRAQLIITGEDSEIYLHGIVKQCQFFGASIDQKQFSYAIIITSPLEKLQRQQNARVFVNQNIADIVNEILQKSGWSNTAYIIKIREQYPIREFAMQLNETDFAFITRLLSYYGLFYYFVQNQEGPVLWITDDLQNFPLFSPKELAYHSESGTHRVCETVYRFTEQVCTLPQQIILKNYHYQTPDEELVAQAENQTQIPGFGTQYYYGCNYQSQAEGEVLAKVYMQELDWQRQTFIAETDCRSLQLGQLFSLTNHPIDEYNGHYRVISLEFMADQIQSDPQLTYQAKALLTQAKNEYRAEIRERPKFNHVIPALIESNNENNHEAYLDDWGRYRVRFFFDAESPKGEASAPLRLLQSYGGKINQGQSYGIHFPLRPGTQVAVGFVEGDLDRPVILGVIPNAEHPTTINNKNSSQHTWRTWEGNELTFEDQPDQSYVLLATKNYKNRFKLAASQDQHRIDLISEEGKLEVYAKKMLQLEIGGDYLVETESDYVTAVKNNHYLVTKNAGITYESGVDAQLITNQQLQIRAENDAIIKSGQNLDIKSKSFSAQTEQGDLTLCSEQNACLQAHSGVVIHGNISIGQGAGKMTCAAGSLNLQGIQITLIAPEINVYGMTL